MNRLARERSPYLLQHAGNPVDWYPWGDDAFARARAEDKPIFLSIGYSTCHWCHVMEHESFVERGDRRAAEPRLRLDQGRSRGAARRRPRLHGVRAGDDRLRRLADDGVPDAGPEAVLRRHLLSADIAVGQAGLRSTCCRSSPACGRTIAPRVEQAAGELFERLRLVTDAGRQSGEQPTVAEREALDVAIEQFQMAFDTRAWRLRRCAEVSASVGAAVSAARARPPLGRRPRRAGAAADGDRDAARDGARRHARSHRRRLSPLLGRRRLARPAFREDALRPGAARRSPTSRRGRRRAIAFFCDVAEDTLAYVMRDMTDPAADSTRPRMPTAFLPSTRATPARTRRRGRSTSGPTPRSAELAWRRCRSCPPAFRDRSGGQRAAGSAGEFTGKNLLYSRESRSTTSPATGAHGGGRAGGARRACVTALFAARARRPRPHLDDKVLTAWNGLMIAAFARAARVLAGAARRGARTSPPPARAAGFIRSTLVERVSAASCCGATAPARPESRLRRGLCVPDLRSAGAVSGRRRRGVARVGEELQSAQDERFWDARKAAGSAPPGTTRPCCCG